MSNNYTAEDIKHLDTRTAFRTRIEMYLGSSDTDGIYQALKEIINNATDEALAGYGNLIEITVDETINRFTVRDYGRGVPFKVDENGRNTLVAIYTESHTGGKFDKNVYKNSSGLNGIGGTAVCMSSNEFSVTSHRNGKGAVAIFGQGNLIEYKEFDTDEPDGTCVSFVPDKQVFRIAERNLTYEDVCKEMKAIAYLNPKVKFILRKTNIKEILEEKTFYSENGIIDFINDTIEQPLMRAPIYTSVCDQNDELEIAFIWTNSHYQEYVFVNGLRCVEGGAPVTGAKTTITNVMKRLAGKDLLPDLIRKGLVFVINCKVANPSFANQTKSKINNPNLRTLASEAFKQGLEEFSHTNDFSTIIEMMKKMQKAEQAADKAREAVLTHNKEMNAIRKSKLAFIDKLKDCEKLGEESILLCVEGDSAASMVAKARDTNNYGLLALRGKCINCLSNPEEKYLANEEIKLLLYASGIDINNYNPNKLRYGKIGICTDGDFDGSHIALLIIAALYKLCPQFLKENRLYWLRAPLFCEQKAKNRYYYYSDEEKNQKNHGGIIQRLKGLGSMSPEEMEESMFSSQQKLEQLTFDDNAFKTIENLMGENVDPRKEFVFNKIDFSQYGDYQ